MTRIDWNLISDGGTFESLMHMILCAEDPSTIAFGRPGPDAGQDARSEDGTTVYQAKYRSGMKMSHAISAAKEELKSIRDYRVPDNKNSSLWSIVSRWVLVGNFEINGNDNSDWVSQIVPAFQSIGMTAEYWGIERLNSILAKHPEIQEIFFGEKNRVLLGLKETRELLNNELVGNEPLDHPFLHRTSEFEVIESFSSDPMKRVLPLTGPAGIGKSRLAYEGLVRLSNEGWRVFWGLTEEMSQSQSWFRQLNSKQPTIFVLDEPDTSGLLRRVVDQLAAQERWNWKVIYVSKSKDSAELVRYRSDARFDAPLQLEALNENQSHELIRSLANPDTTDGWVHSVYKFTQGVPSWMTLIVDLHNRGMLPDLSALADNLTEKYLEGSLRTFEGDLTPKARLLIRWLSLWGTIRLDASDVDAAKLDFLAAEGIPANQLNDLLRKLVSAGLVKSWGVGKSLFTIEPLMLRQGILSEWLLQTAPTVKVSPDGNHLIARLLKSEIPRLDSVLRTLTRLICPKLAAHDSVSFLKPWFELLEKTAADGDVVVQDQVVELLQKIGAADPEGALQVLSAVRRNEKPDIGIEDPFWGQHTFSQKNVLAKIPWQLFLLGENVDDVGTARRLLEEFRHYFYMEFAPGGKNPEKLLPRLIRQSQNSSIFLEPANAIAKRDIKNKSSWPYVGVILEALMGPVTEVAEWTASFTVQFSRHALDERSREWEVLRESRALCYSILKEEPEVEVREQLWKVVRTSHQSMHRATLHEALPEETLTAFRDVLKKDIAQILEILRVPNSITFEHATIARDIWCWYLKYGQDYEWIEQVRECELLYQKLDRWKVQDFFKYHEEMETANEVSTVAALFREASSFQITQFFEAAQSFLISAQRSKQELEYSFQVSRLANELSDVFHPEPGGISTPVTEFVATELKKQEKENPLSWWFCIELCIRHLNKTKLKEQQNTGPVLQYLVEMAKDKERFVQDFYSNPHPNTTGPLTQVELDYVEALRDKIPLQLWSSLIGKFYSVDPNKVQSLLETQLTITQSAAERSKYFHSFYQSMRFTLLRFQENFSCSLIEWFLDCISKYQLDGSLLGSSDFDWIRKQVNYTMDGNKFLEIMRSRIALENNVTHDSDFTITPSDFRVSEWCVFDFQDRTQSTAFAELCELVLLPTFTSYYWIPKYLSHLDRSGEHVASFVREFLIDHPESEPDTLYRLSYLASNYADTSAAWRQIALPIIDKSVSLRRDERDRIFFGLSKKENGVVMSWGNEVPHVYVSRLEAVKQARDVEPIDSSMVSYWQWAIQRADETLQRETEQAEGESHE